MPMTIAVKDYSIDGSTVDGWISIAPTVSDYLETVTESKHHLSST